MAGYEGLTLDEVWIKITAGKPPTLIAAGKGFGNVYTELEKLANDIKTEVKAVAGGEQWKGPAAQAFLAVSREFTSFFREVLSPLHTYKSEMDFAAQALTTAISEINDYRDNIASLQPPPNGDQIKVINAEAVKVLVALANEYTRVINSLEEVPASPKAVVDGQQKDEKEKEQKKDEEKKKQEKENKAKPENQPESEGEEAPESQTQDDGDGEGGSAPDTGTEQQSRNSDSGGGSGDESGDGSGDESGSGSGSGSGDGTGSGGGNGDRDTAPSQTPAAPDAPGSGGGGSGLPIGANRRLTDTKRDLPNAPKATEQGRRHRHRCGWRRASRTSAWTESPCQMPSSSRRMV